MHNFLIYSNLIAGFWFIFMALITKTKNLQSSLVFKAIPFFAGAALVFNGLKLLKLI